MLSVTLGEVMEPPKIAVIVVLPLATFVANPGEAGTWPMVATNALLEFQLAPVVISMLTPSEYVPMA